ncbi:MAG TPA: EVE domain-containing protein [Candidatus Thalassarchaeaceae archaeon]|nr:EVE domain-containing protein [Candidatus Thalassarchaeaceae archaeon]HJN70553.1 EVE domain-containing protein [Candidatus Thalassarchaeaceae archaeon]|tara:strand:- start:1004 stop:1489 length:486 start_codon:yes stop_codon:yes gene_type:complete
MKHGEDMVNHWLMKSEPHVYPWSQLVEDGSTHWDGVRNYQARNIMRDKMKNGDLVFFYHSNCKPPHIAGIAKVCKEAYPDFTAQDPNSNYFDPKASPENPRWMMVDIEPVLELNPLELPELRENPALEGMPLLQRGQRLSVQPVTAEHFAIVCQMGGIKTP